MHRRIFALPIVVTLGILAMAPSAAAGDAEPAWLSVQEDLDTAVTELGRAPGAAAGLAAIVVVAESGRLVLHWKGAVPPATARMVDRLRRTVPIEVRAARFSAAELIEASRAFVALPGVVSAGPNAEGSGIVATAEASALKRIPRLTTARGVSVPVAVTAGAPATPAVCTGGRLSDCSPYSGGARYVNPEGGQCTTGFKVVVAQRLYLISAAHCANNGQRVMNGNQGEVVGTVEADTPGRDIMLIQPPNGLLHHVYVGNANGSTFRRVTGASTSAVGQVVCTSGSFTGQNCNIQVTAVNQFVNFTGLGIIGPLVSASHLTGGVAVGRGDSGGPVISIASGSTTAKGTITGYATASVVPCPPPPNSSSQCGSTVYYADIGESMRFYGGAVAIN